jgi:hypothetical protein
VIDAAEHAGQPLRISVQQVASVIDELGEPPSRCGVGGQVPRQVGVGTRPVAPAVGADEREQGVGDPAVHRSLVVPAAQVVVERLVVEAVDGLAVLTGLDQVRADMLQQPRQVRLDVAVPGEGVSYGEPYLAAG